jgi:hypothetical protein
MATMTATTLTDDLDGSPADTTVRFGYDGALYEIDLSTDHAQAFEEAIEPFLAAARVVRGRPHAPAAPHGGRSAAEARTVRAWARANGIEVAARGRIPGTVLSAYRGAGGV